MSEESVKKMEEFREKVVDGIIQVLNELEPVAEEKGQANGLIATPVFEYHLFIVRRDENEQPIEESKS